MHFLAGIEVQTVNCRDTIQGCYHFTYEVEFGGGSICDSPNSVVTACQQPGSVYVDNQVFDMQFGVCPDVLSSIDDSEFTTIDLIRSDVETIFLFTR